MGFVKTIRSEHHWYQIRNSYSLFRAITTERFIKTQISRCKAQCRDCYRLKPVLFGIIHCIKSRFDVLLQTCCIVARILNRPCAPPPPIFYTLAWVETSQKHLFLLGRHKKKLNRFFFLQFNKPKFLNHFIALQKSIG